MTSVAIADGTAHGIDLGAGAFERGDDAPKLVEVGRDRENALRQDSPCVAKIQQLSMRSISTVWDPAVRQQVTDPAVIAIAMPPPIVTRTAARSSGAPPRYAPNAPSAASATSDVPEIA